MKKIAQEALPDYLKRKLKYSSYIPVLNALYSTFDIRGVLELGAGYYSTPYFFNKSENVISIESDFDWIKFLEQSGTLGNYTESRQLIYHQLPHNIIRDTLRKDIPQETLDSAIQFYKQYIKNTNLLFIDNYAGFRLEALSKLYMYYDFIVYHDTESESDHYYSYSDFKIPADYYCMSNTTFLTHTNVMVSVDFCSKINKMLEEMEKESIKFLDKFNAI